MRDRVDIEIDMDIMTQLLPPQVRADPRQFAALVDRLCSEVKGTLESLEPDDAYIHTSFIKVHRPLVCSRCGKE